MIEGHETRTKELESEAQLVEQPAASSSLTRVLLLPIVVFLLVPIVLSLVVKYLFGL